MARKQREKWPGLISSRSGSVRQRFCATGHRGWNRHPTGKCAGFGTLPGICPAVCDPFKQRANTMLHHAMQIIGARGLDHLHDDVTGLVGASAYERFNELVKEWTTLKADAESALR